MKTANNINELAYLLKAGETEIKIGFKDCSDLYLKLFQQHNIELSYHDLSKWDVSDVTDMSYMFYKAKHFDGDLSKWDVSNVKSMFHMFSDATCFDGNIIRWDVSKVEDVRWMFNDAKSFNQDISKWDLSNANEKYGMLQDCGIANQFKPEGID